MKTYQDIADSWRLQFPENSFLVIKICEYKQNIIIISLLDKTFHVILVYQIGLISLNLYLYKERERTNC